MGRAAGVQRGDLARDSPWCSAWLGGVADYDLRGRYGHARECVAEVSCVAPYPDPTAARYAQTFRGVERVPEWPKEGSAGCLKSRRAVCGNVPLILTGWPPSSRVIRYVAKAGFWI